MICPRCETTVSDTAERCPQCNKRLRRRKWNPLILPLVVTSGLALGFWTLWRVQPSPSRETEMLISMQYEDSEMAFLEAENRRLKEELSSLEERLAAAQAAESTTKAEVKETTAATEAPPTEPRNTELKLKVGETWRIEGQWELTLHEVRATGKRDSQYEKESHLKTPAQVVIVRYSYTNLGFQDETNGDNLFLWPERIIDDAKELGTYYGDIAQNFPQDAPIGVTMKDAEYAFALNNESKTVMVIFTRYDGLGRRHQVTYEDVPVNN